jgi:cytochrome c553
MKHIFLFIVLVFSTFLSAESGFGNVEVKVNGEFISDFDIVSVLKKEDVKVDVFLNKMRKDTQFKLLQKIINKKLLIQQAKSENITNSKMYLEKLELLKTKATPDKDLKDELALKIWMFKKLQNIKIQKDKVKSFYMKNKERIDAMVKQRDSLSDKELKNSDIVFKNEAKKIEKYLQVTKFKSELDKTIIRLKSKADIKYIRFLNFKNLQNYTLHVEQKDYGVKMAVSLVFELDKKIDDKEFKPKVKSLLSELVNNYPQNFFYNTKSTNEILELSIISQIRDYKKEAFKNNYKHIKSIFISNLQIEKALKKQIADVKSFYAKKCASCHGVDGMISVLSKTKQIAKMTKDDIFKTLVEIKNTKPKSVMYPIVKDISDKDLEKLSEYVQSL